jgi:hypothetical protein
MTRHDALSRARRGAAAGAAAVATGAVLPLTAPAGASPPAPPVAVGQPALTVRKALPAAPRDAPGCSTHDGVMVGSADMVDPIFGRKGVTIGTAPRPAALGRRPPT